MIANYSKFTNLLFIFFILVVIHRFIKKAHMKSKILIVTLITLIFLEGIWFEKLISSVKSMLNHFFVNSSVYWIKNIALLLNQKIPVIMENLFVFILAIPHLLIVSLCLKLIYTWHKKLFIGVYFIGYLIFCVISLLLIYAYSYDARLFKVWKDFIELFFSPFPLIFMFLIWKLFRKNS